MLDGILGRGFSAKCKSEIKATRSRIEVVRRRAEARQRFLKEDLAKLLANGLDINAYGRTEEFLSGLNLLSCYDFIEHSCEFIVKRLSVMQKIRECPEDCREAVGSLMFAAARFSDLPELRDLRDLFQERYGTSLECFVNQKFVEKLSPTPPTVEKKIQLLRDIASEFSIKWESKGFEQRMAPSTSLVQAQTIKYGPSPAAADKYKFLDGKGVLIEKKNDVLPTGRGDLCHDSHAVPYGSRRDELQKHHERRDDNRQQSDPLGETCPKVDSNSNFYRQRDEPMIDRRVLLNGKDGTSEKTLRPGSSSHGNRPDGPDIECSKRRSERAHSTHMEERQDGVDVEHTNHTAKTREAYAGDRHEAVSHGNLEAASRCGIIPRPIEEASSFRGQVIQKHMANLTKKLQEKEPESFRSQYNSPRPPPYVKSKDNAMPPPYVKPKDSKLKANRESKNKDSSFDGLSMSPSLQNTVYKSHKSDESLEELNHPQREAQSLESASAKGHVPEKEFSYQDDIIKLPRPRSVRKKHHKSSSRHSDVGSLEDARVVKRSSSSRRRDHPRKGLQILFDDELGRRDEEERMIDKLLLHYSKKPSNCDVTKLRTRPERQFTHQAASGAGQSSSHDRSTDHPDAGSDIVPPPSRSVSLPHEQSARAEASKIFTRANSFQPDNQARHVHPKLPDYDDLAARFAALRGR